MNGMGLVVEVLVGLGSSCPGGNEKGRKGRCGWANQGPTRRIFVVGIGLAIDHPKAVDGSRGECRGEVRGSGGRGFVGSGGGKAERMGWLFGFGVGADSSFGVLGVCRARVRLCVVVGAGFGRKGPASADRGS